MKNWPEIEVLTRQAQKRGGQKTSRAAKAAFLVQVTAQTRMKCGAEIKVSNRVPHNEADAKKRSSRTAVQTQGRMHIDRCKKGCK